MGKRPDKIDADFQKALADHARDPLYVNNHEKALGQNGFSAGYAWLRAHSLDHCLNLMREMHRMRKLQKDYFKSQTNVNLKAAKRQEQIVDDQFAKFIVAQAFEPKPGNPPAEQGTLM
jgi:hypothetical protein